MRRPPPPHDERGSVAIVVVVSLTMLLGFASLVVDVGLNWAARTSAQSAADSAALAGAQGLGAGAPGTVVAAVDDELAQNLPGYSSASDGAWELNGDESDGEVECYTPPLESPAPTTTCPPDAIAVQVITPPVHQAYAFAGVFGARQTNVKAAASAQVFTPGNFTFPWSYLPSAADLANGGLICVSEDPAQAPPQCNGSASSGNFRPIDSPRPPDDVDANDCRFDMDHTYEDSVEDGIFNIVAPRDDGLVVHDDGCLPLGEIHNYIRAGAAPIGKLGEGLSEDNESLLRKPSSAFNLRGPIRKTHSVLGATIAGSTRGDDRFAPGPTLIDGDFLNPTDAAAFITDNYQPNGFFLAGKTFADYAGCLATRAGCQLFNDKIFQSPRFGYVPIPQSIPTSGGWTRVVSLQPVFIEGEYDSAGQPTTGSNTVNCPCSGNTGNPVVTLSVYLVQPWMLPVTGSSNSRDVPFIGDGPRAVHLVK